MSGTSEGGKKSVLYQDMREKGRKGAQALNANKDKKADAARKAAETRKQNEPRDFHDLGSFLKGGVDKE